MTTTPISACSRCGRRRKVREGRQTPLCHDCHHAVAAEGPPPPRDTHDRGDLAEFLVLVACQLAGAVRDDPDDVARILATHADNLDALAVVLAAMVPDDRSAADLLAWMDWHAEYRRLRDLGVRDDAARTVAREVA